MAQRSGAMKLAKLRELMETVPVGGIKGKGIQALIVNSQDAHQSEYLRDRDKRLRYITGFKGSWGTAIITADKALFWTDGRYTIQASKELDPPESWTLMKEDLPGTPTRDAWIISNLPPKSVIGADPNLLSYEQWVQLYNTLSTAGYCLLPLEENLIDKVWGEEQPPLSNNPVMAHPLEFSGKIAGRKVELSRDAMKKNGATILVITALDDVAYLLNLRGSDIPFNPVFFAFVILTLDDLHLFIDISVLSDNVKSHLTREGVNPIYHPYENVHTVFKQLASSCTEKIWVSDQSSYAIHMDCGDATKYIAMTPVCHMKAIKNSVEIEGMIYSHARDSVALVKYFAWLENKVKKGEYVTEISGADQLQKFREEQQNYVGLSFPTISSVGPHGSIIHYLPSPETDVPITDKELYLCDSGAQYLDGTTDVTRTFHFGEPTAFERECFTRVFKGQCNLSSAIFPAMLKGNFLDTLARMSLWKVGLNYLHGTGHGVGSYLYVHETVSGISWRPYPSDPGLQPGMFLSNEPGFYEDNKFGIRLENVELVVPAETPYNFKNRGFLTFETMTLVPIQLKMLDVSLLTDTEIEYLNKYHKKCLDILEPMLEGPENLEALQWLKKETEPITRN